MNADQSVNSVASGQPSTRESLRTLLAGNGRQLSLLAATAFIGGLLEAFFLVLVSKAAFAITESGNQIDLVGSVSLSLRYTVLVALALVIARCFAAVWAAWLSANLSTSVVAEIRRTLADSFLSASWEVQQSDRTGQLQELLTTFANRGATLLVSLTTGISAAFSLVALLGIAIAVNPIGAIAVIGAALLLGLALRPLRSAVRARAQESAETGMQFASSLNEVSQLGLEIHVFRIQEQTELRVRDLIALNTQAERRLTFARGLVVPIYSSLAYLALVVALGVISISNAANIASLGAVILVMLRSLSYGQGLQNSYASVTASLPFVEQLHSEIERYRSGHRYDGGQPVSRVGQLDLSSVEFSYDKSHAVIRDFSVSIQEREVVGIVGPSGGGKSTLVQLLLGLREPDSGSILADGRPISEMSRSEWARKVTFVPQTSHLIAGTVADNIRLLRDGVSQEDIEHAAQLAHLSDDIAGFTEGYDRQVGEQGGHLSGGQQQRLCIARALVENPDVLILDEPTSALDVRSEHLIRQTLTELRERMTIIIVAHRLSTLDICDRIMVIQDGELKGFDTPARLAQSSAFYSEALTLSGLK